jgi:hypothetical protein
LKPKPYRAIVGQNCSVAESASVSDDANSARSGICEIGFAALGAAAATRPRRRS